MAHKTFKVASDDDVVVHLTLTSLVRYESSRSHKIDGTKLIPTGNRVGEKKQRKQTEGKRARKVASKERRRQEGTKTLVNEQPIRQPSL